MMEAWLQGDDRQRGGLWARLLVGALLFLASLPLAATEREYYFERLDDEHGLLQNSIHSLFQDRAGYLWVGTQGGLHQYDGYRFKRYEHDADDPGSLPDSVVRAISEGTDGRLWIGTLTGGVARLDPARGVFEAFALAADAPSRNERESIQALAFDPARGVWVGTRHGLDLLDPSSRVRRTVIGAEGDAVG